MASTLTVVPISDFVRDWVASKNSFVNRISQALGVPPETIIAPLIQEAGTILPEVYDTESGSVGPDYSIIDRVLDATTKMWSHESIAADYHARLSDIENGIAPTGNPFQLIIYKGLLHPTA